MTAVSTLAAKAGEEIEERDIGGVLNSFHLIMGDIVSSVACLSYRQLKCVRAPSASHRCPPLRPAVI